MSPSNLNKEDPEAIRMAFQRLCHGGGSVTVGFADHRGEFKVLAETPDRIILGISDVERGQWGLKPGTKVTLGLRDRGLPFEAVVEFQGHGRLHGVEACHLALPRLLRATETHRLADYVPDRPIPCSYADQHSDVRQGSIPAFGPEGLELVAPESVQSLTEVLRVNAESTVEFHPPGAESSFVLSARVAYLGDSYWGLRFPDGMDPSLLGRYRMWVQEARRGQAQLDLNRFDPGGVEARPGGVSRGEPAGPKVRLHVDRDPLILVLAEGEAFPAHLASAVGRKFGVAALDLIRGLVHPCLVGLGADGGGDWGRVRLILIHHLVRSGSALELCRRLVHEEQCPLPILLAGTEEEFDLKRNRALSAGAVDYLVVEPFRVLSLLRSLGETLQLFT